MANMKVRVFLLLSVAISLTIGLPIKDDEIDELIYRLQELRNQNHYEDTNTPQRHRFDLAGYQPAAMRSPQMAAARHRLQMHQQQLAAAADVVRALGSDSDELTAGGSAGVVLKRNLDSIGGANLLKRNLDSIGGANLLKRSVDSLGGAYLLKRK